MVTTSRHVGWHLIPHAKQIFSPDIDFPLYWYCTLYASMDNKVQLYANIKNHVSLKH